MKTPIKLLPIFILFLASTVAYSQAKKPFEVPKSYSFKTPEEYAAYDSIVLACSNWMCKLPKDQWVEKRNEANTFLMAWIDGNPKVSVELDPRITSFSENNPHLLPIFVSGWVKYALTKPEGMDNIKGNIAGLKAICKYYDGNPNLNKDKTIEHLIALQKKGKLKSWVTEQLKS